MNAYVYYLEKIAIEITKIRDKYKHSDVSKILSPQEIKELMTNAKEQTFKTKSTKQYVRDQAKGNWFNTNRRKVKVFLKRKMAIEIE